MTFFKENIYANPTPNEDIFENTIMHYVPTFRKLELIKSSSFITFLTLFSYLLKYLCYFRGIEYEGFVWIPGYIECPARY